MGAGRAGGESGERGSLSVGELSDWTSDGEVAVDTVSCGAGGAEMDAFRACGMRGLRGAGRVGGAGR